MKIIYANTKSVRSKWRDLTDDVLLLQNDNWDDFGFTTRFPTWCRINGQEVELGAIRILFDNERSSHSFLQGKITSGWNGIFPIDNINYISVPEEITFYEQIVSLLGAEHAVIIASLLRDASYLIHAEDDADALRMIGTRGFDSSLQRERSAQKAFADGWKILGGETLNINDLTFNFRDVFNNLSQLKLNFVAKSPLPHDVNVVIGPNGVGKSRLFSQMVKVWLEPDEKAPGLLGANFDPRPNLNQLVAVSYSPFEQLPVDTDDGSQESKSLHDKDVYRFFGFRGREKALRINGRKKIRHNLSVPKANAARSLIQCLTDDTRYKTISAWAKKLQTLQSVIGTAIDFDFAAVRLKPDAPIETILIKLPNYVAATIDFSDGNEEPPARYLPITTELASYIDADALLENIVEDDGVTFFKNKNPILLSSGQRLFFYIVVNVLGAIRRNSLILVDEPELFLHPTLEVQFVGMLKQILASYGSKAVLATHSVLTVREIPGDCVHVFERTNDGLVITNPPFETFGGDAQRISSYVFGDRAVSKPYEIWLKDLLNEHDTADAVIELLGNDINEEMIIQLHAMEQEKW